MTRTRHVLIGTASALALAALPLNLQSLLSGSLEPAAALAKSDHSGGNGNGGGHGGGNGHSGEHGKSGERGKSGTPSGSSVGGSGQPGRLKVITGEDTHGAKGKKATVTKVAKSSGKSSKKKTDEIETAALPENEEVVGPKEKKLDARLAGLHSLNRNFRAYLNSQDPRMAKIRDFVLASAHLEIDEAAFQKALDDTNLATYDPSFYNQDPTLTDLDDRLDALEQTPAVEPEETALRSFLDNSPEVDALRAAEAAGGTDDAALKEALLAAANQNRVTQYGDDYINDDVMDWAKGLLGVGAATGKIDEVRQTLETDQQ
jgi:hypothetical protein